MAIRKDTKELIIHCSATPEGRDYTVADIDRWHKERGFNANGIHIGYNYVIYRDGSVHVGRPENWVGAHCTGHNSISIGICYIGGCEARKRADGKYHAKDTRTPEQKRALRELLTQLKAKYPKATIHGHREFANKSCPAFDVSEYADI